MAILLDTGYLFSLYNLDDRNHLDVKSSYNLLLDGEFGIPILIDYVFDELVTLIQFRTKRNDIATDIGNIILSDCEKYIQFSRVNKSIFSKSWKLFENQSGNKFLSFTDCVIIEFGQSLNINTIATLDNHFKSWVKIIPNHNHPGENLKSEV